MNRQKTNPQTRTDLLLLSAFCGFLFFYGLGAFGLVGADEPRYAQIAREMLGRSDWITPTLQGKPWLEKPVLYYWQAMVSFRAAGISDRAARLPGAFDAAMLIAAISFFPRRLLCHRIAGVVCVVRKPTEHLSRGLLHFFGAWHLSQRPGRARVIGGYYLFFRCYKARLARHPAHPLDSRHRPLSRRHVALVHRRPVAKSGIFPGLHPRTQSCPLLAGCLSPPPAFLVLPACVLAGHDALDPRAHRRGCRARSLDLVRRQGGFLQSGRFLAAVSTHLDARIHPVFQRVAIEAARLHSARRACRSAAGCGISRCPPRLGARIGGRREGFASVCRGSRSSVRTAGVCRSLGRVPCHPSPPAVGNRYLRWRGRCRSLRVGH